MTLRAKKLGNNGKAAASVLLAFMGMASIGLSLYSYYHNKAPKPRYPEYQAALNSPAPTQIIATLAQLVERSYFAPGWQATEVIQQAQHYQIKLIADRGKLETLDTWADQKGYQLAINTQGALLNLAPNTPSRQPITHIYPIGKITTQLMDKANRLFDSPDISIDKLVMHAHSREAQITITAQAITTQQLLYLGEQLTKLPLVLRKTQLSITPSALLNIELKLSAWGT